MNTTETETEIQPITPASLWTLTRVRFLDGPMHCQVAELPIQTGAQLPAMLAQVIGRECLTKHPHLAYAPYIVRTEGEETVAELRKSKEALVVEKKHEEDPTKPMRLLLRNVHRSSSIPTSVYGASGRKIATARFNPRFSLLEFELTWAEYKKVGADLHEGARPLSCFYIAEIRNIPIPNEEVEEVISALKAEVQRAQNSDVSEELKGELTKLQQSNNALLAQNFKLQQELEELRQQNKPSVELMAEAQEQPLTHAPPELPTEVPSNNPAHGFYSREHLEGIKSYKAVLSIGRKVLGANAAESLTGKKALIEAIIAKQESQY